MITGLIVGFFTALLGWQINLISIQRGILRKSRLATFSVGAGSTTADIILIYMAFIGASFFIGNPACWKITKWIGIVTILTVSFRFLTHKVPPLKEIEAQKKQRDPGKNFLIGFFVVIGNPAIYLLWIGIVSFLMTHLPHLKTHHEQLFFLIGFPVGALSWFTILSMAVLPTIRNWENNRLNLISRLSAVVLLIAASILIFEKF